MCRQDEQGMHVFGKASFAAIAKLVDRMGNPPARVDTKATETSSRIISPFSCVHAGFQVIDIDLIVSCRHHSQIRPYLNVTQS